MIGNRQLKEGVGWVNLEREIGVDCCAVLYCTGWISSDKREAIRLGVSLYGLGYGNGMEGKGYLID